MIRHYYIIIFFLIIHSLLFAQKEANIWYFGDHAGLDFNSGAPVALTNSAMYQGEGCASISDSSGNILFYTNGMTVWNKNHIQMPNGYGLLGHGSSSQSAVIVQKPDFNTIFYIFTTDAAHNDLINGFNYSIVDLSQNGGLGDVISKNNLLYTPVSEKVTAVRHSNQTDIWIITHEWNSNSFRAYLLTNTGLNSIENSIPGYPVISSVGSYHVGSIWGAIGYLKASQKGNKIGLAIHNNKYEIFDFYNLTGIISNPISITSPVSIRQYGVEFSPDESKLYVSKITFPSYIYQYDLNEKKEDFINKSAYLVASSLDERDYSALQLGPDGKIYVALNTGLYLSVINNPNEPGDLCNYTEDAVFLENRLSYRGLPNIIPENFTINFFYNNDCFGDTTFFTISYFIIIDSVYWDFDDPSSGPANYSTELNPYHIFTSPGEFTVTLTIYSNGNSNTITQIVVINNGPEICLGNDTTICSGDSIILNAGSGHETYLWQDGSEDSIFIAFESGLYWVKVTDSNGCIATDTVLLTVIPSQNVFLGNDTTICEGDYLFLDPGPGFESYLWQDGSSYQTFIADTAGIYWVEVTDTNSCSARDSILLIVRKIPENFLGNDTVICPGDIITLNAGEGFVQYLWQDGSSDSVFIADSVGTYWVYVEDEIGCSGSDTVVLFPFIPPSLNLPDEVFICKGDSIKFHAGSGYLFYNWQDGSNDSVFIAYDEGLYWVSILTDCGFYSDSVLLSFYENAYLNLGNDTNICPGETIELNPGDFNEYLWQDGSEDNLLIVTGPGIYWVKIFDGKCYASDTIFIDECSSLWVPNIFTPNGDNFNDYFYAVGSNITKFKLEIFNRWGRRLQTLNNINEKWDGKYKGNKCSQGVYYWIANFEISDKSGNKINKSLKGSITLYR